MKDRHISRPWETLSFCCSPSWSSLNTNRSSILCVFHLPQTFNPSTSIVLWPFCWFWSAVVISLSPSLSMRCRSSALSKRSVHFSGPFPWYRILPWSILRPSYVLRQSYELIKQSGAPFLASVLCAAHFHHGMDDMVLSLSHPQPLELWAAQFGAYCNHLFHNPPIPISLPTASEAAYSKQNLATLLDMHDAHPPPFKQKTGDHI